MSELLTLLTITNVINIKLTHYVGLTKVNIYWLSKNVGYCYLSFLGDTIYLDILNINYKCQGKGYGTKFIEYLRQYGNIEGEFTYNSKGFYEKCGAKIKDNSFYFPKFK